MTINKQSYGSLLAEIPEDKGNEIFKDKDGNGYATFESLNGTHRETHPIRSKAYRGYLQTSFYNQYECVAGNQAMQDAIEQIDGKAQIGELIYEVFVRMAKADGNIYVDLCNEYYKAVEITQHGWEIIDSYRIPVKFVRKKGMLSLPIPLKDSQLTTADALSKLWEFINVENESDKRLVIGFLLACFRYGQPFPILILSGEQGSGKSVASRVIRSLVDPNTASLRSTPRKVHDLFISANNSWLLCHDNLSGLPIWLSDALCRISTGGGFASRQLYKDEEENIIDVKRPMILNGIDDIIGRGDLQDRAIVINLPSIKRSKRTPEVEFWKNFEKEKPYIIGALLTVLAGALKEYPTTKLKEYSRMADFEKWVTSAEPSLGWSTGTFSHAYRNNRNNAIEAGMANDPVAQAVIKLVAKEGGRTATSTELMEKLGKYVPDTVLKSNAFPKSPQALSISLKRLTPNLRELDVSLEQHRQSGSGGRFWSIGEITETSICDDCDDCDDEIQKDSYVQQQIIN